MINCVCQCYHLHCPASCLEKMMRYGCSSAIQAHPLRRTDQWTLNVADHILSYVGHWYSCPLLASPTLSYSLGLEGKFSRQVSTATMPTANVKN